MRTRRRHRKIELVLFRQRARIFGDEISLMRERAGCRRVLCFRDGLKISVLISQCVNLGNGTSRWGVKVNRFERDYPTLICRCAPSNSSFLDFYVVPKVDTPCTNRFLIKENDPWLKTGRRLSHLSQLRKVAERLISASNSGCCSVSSAHPSL